MKPAHAVLEEREQAEMSSVHAANMKPRTPLRVFQPAANQRLSCRKITCKAFPFVVEEQRVTSYFLLVKKKKQCTVGDIVDLPPNFPFTCGWTWTFVPCSLRTFPCFLLELLGGNGWLRSLRNGARLWKQESKSVGCLLRWLWMFSASAFYGSRSVALKGEEIHLGCSAFCFFWCLFVSDVVFVLTGVMLCVRIEFSCQIKSSVYEVAIPVVMPFISLHSCKGVFVDFTFWRVVFAVKIAKMCRQK